MERVLTTARHGRHPRTTSASLITGAFLAFALAGCLRDTKQSPSPGVSVAPSQMDASTLLKHKIECRRLGSELAKQQWPEGNTVAYLNQGMFHFEPEFAYATSLNTCVMLTGEELVDPKTRAKRVFSAHVTDVLTNKTLATYLVINGTSAPASTTDRSGFLQLARKLFGEPSPKWLDEAPDITPQSQ